MQNLCLPLSLLDDLASVPSGGPLVLLVRHSTRGPLPTGRSGDDVPLTPDGEQLAFKLGSLLGPRLAAVHSSPIARCVRTGQMVLLGGGRREAPRVDERLGDPGVFVADRAEVWRTFQSMGFHALLRRLVADGEAVPGFNPVRGAAQQLVGTLLEESASPGIHVWVTHDSIVSIVSSVLLCQDPVLCLPEFLEGMWMWRDGAGARILYRGQRCFVLLTGSRPKSAGRKAL